MSWMDSVKNFLGSNGHTEDEFEEETEEFEDEAEEEVAQEQQEEEPAEQPQPPAKPSARLDLHRFGSNRQAERKAESKVEHQEPKPIIDFDENKGGTTTMDNFTGERSQIFLYKPESLDGIRKIADRVNQKKTVILNLENQSEEFIKTVIDFFSGVAYANHGQLSPIADRTYIVTPEDTDMSKPEGANIGDSELGNLNIFDDSNHDVF
jgi:FtsZ-interacting cell division protein YlmF